MVARLPSWFVLQPCSCNREIYYESTWSTNSGKLSPYYGSIKIHFIQQTDCIHYMEWSFYSQKNKTRRKVSTRCQPAQSCAGWRGSILFANASNRLFTEHGCPAQVAQWWACRTHDFVVVNLIQGMRRLFFPVYFRLSRLQKYVRKVVGGFGKKSCVSTGVRKPGNTTSVADRHDMTLAVKVALNPQYNQYNQPQSTANLYWIKTRLSTLIFQYHSTLYQTIPTFHDRGEEAIWKHREKKGKNAGNQHFLLFRQCFLPFPKQISFFGLHLFCHLQMLGIWTSLKILAKG